MVSRGAGGGRDTVAEGRGDGGVAARPHPAAAYRGTAGTAAGAVAGPIDGFTGPGSGGRHIGGHIGLPLRLLGGTVFLFLGGNLLQEFLVHGLELRFQGFQVVGLAQKLLQKVIGFLPLGVHFLLCRVQLLLGFLHLGLFRLQIHLSHFHSVGSVAELL